MISKEKLKPLLFHLPLKPGIYIMRDSLGKIIYVGKSRLLRNRVRSYFSGKHHDSKTAYLVQSVHEIDFIVTNNEIEALVLENNLIKRHKPHFNVMLKDSKTHPYLMVSMSETYPRLLKVRKVKFTDGNRYFGPFPDERGLKFIIDLLSKTYRLCFCKVPVSSKREKSRPCLRFHLGLCRGACRGTVSSEEYHAAVQEVLVFLAGRKTPDFFSLDAQIETFAKEYRFEEAAELRDLKNALLTYFTAQKVEFLSPIDRDVWGTAESPDILVVSLFFIRGGKLVGNRTIEAEREPGISNEEMLGNLMTRFYEDNLIPRSIFSHRKPKPFEAIFKYLSERAGHRVRIGFPAKPELRKLLEMADENAREVLTNLKSQPHERVAEAVLDLESKLSLPRLPMRIECVDISHLQGTDPVASLVVAINGEPRRSEYRRFHVKTVNHADDPAAIAEITRRRFKRLKEEGLPFPDLFLVDGGIPQVNAAFAEMKGLDVDRPVWGLAKKEEILYSPHSSSMKLSITSPAMRMLIKLRNEAHRFANTFQKKVHGKRVIRSALLNLPGVGPKTLQKILVVYGSIKKAGEIPPEKLTKDLSIPLKLAEVIHASLKSSET